MRITLKKLGICLLLLYSQLIFMSIVVFRPYLDSFQREQARMPDGVVNMGRKHVWESIHEIQQLHDEVPFLDRKRESDLPLNRDSRTLRSLVETKPELWHSRPTSRVKHILTGQNDTGTGGPKPTQTPANSSGFVIDPRQPQIINGSVILSPKNTTRIPWILENATTTVMTTTPCPADPLISAAQALLPGATTDNWVFIEPNTRDFTLFSNAYLDMRSSSIGIRLFGLRKSKEKRQKRSAPVFCYLWYTGGDRPMLRISNAQVVVIPETHGKIYSPVRVLCPVGKEKEPLPSHVTLVYDTCHIPRHVVPVLKTTGEASRKFTVCVSPLNMGYSKVKELVNFVEMNRILGADSFTIYNFSCSNEVNKVLAYYRRTGVVEVVDWTGFPLRVDKFPRTKHDPPSESHYYGQVVMLNDCLYRNMFKSRFTVYSDLDELVTPLNHDSWIKLMNALNGNSVGSFMFLNTFFKLEWENDAKAIKNNRIIKNDITVLLKTRRESKITKVGVRTKYIVDGRRIEYVMIHHAIPMRGYIRLTVPVELGLLQHYRWWDDPKGNFNTSIIDRRLHRFTDRLIARIEKTYNGLKV